MRKHNVFIIILYPEVIITLLARFAAHMEVYLKKNEYNKFKIPGSHEVLYLGTTLDMKQLCTSKLNTPKIWNCPIVKEQNGLCLYHWHLLLNPKQCISSIIRLTFTTHGTDILVSNTEEQDITTQKIRQCKTKRQHIIKLRNTWDPNIHWGNNTGQLHRPWLRPRIHWCTRYCRCKTQKKGRC